MKINKKKGLFNISILRLELPQNHDMIYLQNRNNAGNDKPDGMKRGEKENEENNVRHSYHQRCDHCSAYDSGCDQYINHEPFIPAKDVLCYFLYVLRKTDGSG